DHHLQCLRADIDGAGLLTGVDHFDDEGGVHPGGILLLLALLLLEVEADDDVLGPAGVLGPLGGCYVGVATVAAAGTAVATVALAVLVLLAAFSAFGRLLGGGRILGGLGLLFVVPTLGVLLRWDTGRGLGVAARPGLVLLPLFARRG